MTICRLICGCCAALLTTIAIAQDSSLDTTLAWIKRIDGEMKKPLYAKLTSDKLKTMEELKLGGHRKSDNKHLFVPPEEFQHLVPLTNLKKLHLGENDGVTDEALVHIGKLTGLEGLVLWDAPMTDAGAKHLANLKNLRKLDLAFATKLGDGAIAVVTQLTKLEFLNLAGTKVTDVSSLDKLPNLKELRLGKLKPKGVQELRKGNPKLVIK